MYTNFLSFIIASFAGLIIGIGVFFLAFAISCYVSPPYILLDEGNGTYTEQPVMAVGQSLISFVVAFISSLWMTIFLFRKVRKELK